MTEMISRYAASRILKVQETHMWRHDERLKPVIKGKDTRGVLRLYRRDVVEAYAKELQAKRDARLAKRLALPAPITGPVPIEERFRAVVREEIERLVPRVVASLVEELTRDR